MELPILIGDTEDRDFIDDQIIKFNSQQAPFTQKENFIHLDYFVKDNDKIIAGITAILYCWKCLYINVLWVEAKYRYKSLGIW